MVEILDETNRFAHAEAVAEAAEALLTELGVSERSVTLVVIDDAAMGARNLADRGDDAPTDVLSYPTIEPNDLGVPNVPHLGDVFVSLDTAERQGAAHGHGALAEVLVLTAHGIAHLLGHDHPDEAGWRPFRDAQRRILVLAGLGA